MSKKLALKDKKEVIRQIVCPLGMPEVELDNFIDRCEQTGLDPLARQMHCQANRDMKNNTVKYTSFATIDGVRVVAERSGDYLGQDGPFFYGSESKTWLELYDRSHGNLLAARVGVYRKDFKAPLYATAHWSEYGKPFGTWKKMPALMLAKCAESLALRKAFPQDLSGVYTDDELPPEMTKQQEPEPQKPVVNETDSIMVHHDKRRAVIERFEMVLNKANELLKKNTSGVSEEEFFTRATGARNKEGFLEGATTEKIIETGKFLSDWIQSRSKQIG